MEQFHTTKYRYFLYFILGIMLGILLNDNLKNCCIFVSHSPALLTRKAWTLPLSVREGIGFLVGDSFSCTNILCLWHLSLELSTCPFKAEGKQRAERAGIPTDPQQAQHTLVDRDLAWLDSKT